MYYHIQVKGSDKQLKDFNGVFANTTTAKQAAMVEFNVPVTAIQFCKTVPRPQCKNCKIKNN